MGNKIILPIIFAITITLAFSTSETFAMTIIIDDDPPNTSNMACLNSPGTCADKFILTSPQIITDLHFWTIEPNNAITPFNNQVTYTIHNDNAGLPGTIVSGPTTVTTTSVPFIVNPLCTGSFVCYEVWLDIVPGIPLVAGTYWVVIEQFGFISGWAVFLDEPETDGVAFSSTGGAPWTFFDVDVALIITGGVPVGGTVLSPDSVSLLVLEAQSSAVWWLPAVVIAGAGLDLFKIKTKN